MGSACPELVSGPQLPSSGQHRHAKNIHGCSPLAEMSLLKAEMGTEGEASAEGSCDLLSDSVLSHFLVLASGLLFP